MKTYKLNPNPKDKDGKEVDVHSEDRTIVETEEYSDEEYNSFPNSVKEQVPKKKEIGRYTPANLKQEWENQYNSLKDGIEKLNEKARLLSDIAEQFPELKLTGLPAEIKASDKISDLESKKPVQRKKKEK